MVVDDLPLTAVGYLKMNNDKSQSLTYCNHPC